MDKPNSVTVFDLESLNKVETIKIFDSVNDWIINFQILEKNEEMVFLTDQYEMKGIYYYRPRKIKKEKNEFFYDLRPVTFLIPKLYAFDVDESRDIIAFGGSLIDNNGRENPFLALHEFIITEKNNFPLIGLSAIEKEIIEEKIQLQQQKGKIILMRKQR